MCWQPQTPSPRPRSTLPSLVWITRMHTRRPAPFVASVSGSRDRLRQDARGSCQDPQDPRQHGGLNCTLSEHRHGMGTERE
eukprot:scaffold98942_cov57-Phaeocystis_antarctica.AAC.3